MNTATATVNTTVPTDGANPQRRAHIWERVRALRFYDIAAMARELKGGPVGFDVNRKFASYKGTPGGTKGGFADWVLGEFDWAAIESALPPYESQSQTYYASKGKGKQPTKPMPTPRVENVPVPVPDKPAPAPTQAAPVANEADILAKAFKAARAADAEVVKGLHEYVAHEVAKARPIIVTVNNGGKVTSTAMGRQHYMFDKLLKLAAVRKSKGALNIWLTGPAGSGKTTAAENTAKALNIPFHFTGAVDNEFKLLGFVAADGKTVRTPFREAYEHGGVFLLDEVDGCHPSAVLALNAALANGHCDFPDGIVTRHKDCVIMAAANTWGTGATHEYVGRTKLDSASLDRFVMLPWEYDEDLERTTCGNEAWAQKVQAIRHKVQSAGIKHIVSPRASYDGAALLAAGFTEDEVADMLIRKGMPEMQWNQIKRGY